MSAVLKPYAEFEDAEYKPVSFTVSTVPTQGTSIVALPRDRQMVRQQPRDIQRHSPIKHPPTLKSAQVAQSTQVAVALPSPPPARRPVASANQTQAQPATTTRTVPVSRAKSNPKPKASFLRNLTLMKWGSMTVASVLFVSAFAAYGWTVYLQQRWASQYDHLEKLLRDESDMLAIDSGGKATMANGAAQPPSDLYLPAPGGLLFLTPANPRRPADEPPETDDHLRTRTNQPLGY